MSELRASIAINLAGNLERRAQRYGQALGRFSQRGQRDLGRLSRASAALGRGLDRIGNRWTGMLTGAAGAAALRGVLDFDRRLVQLGTQANKTNEEIGALRSQILDVANDPSVRLDPNELLAGIEMTVEKTGDLDLVAQNLRNIALAMRASGAAGRDMGALLADLSEKLGVDGPEQMLATLDTLVRQGEKGAFTLAHMAAQGPMVTSAYASLGRTGQEAVREMGALLQIAQKATGEPARAATAFERLLSEMISKSDELRQRGIEIWDLEEQERTGRKVARSVVDIVSEIIEKSGGDIEKIQKIFGDEAIRPLKFLAAQYQQSGNLDFLQKYYDVQGDGSEILKDAATNAQTASAALNSLYIAFKKFADDGLAEPIQALADAINGMDPDTVQALVKAGAIGVGSLMAASVLTKVGRTGKGLYDLVRGGSKGALGGAAGIPGMAGITPVYVVNLPPGLGGKGGLPGMGGKGGRGGGTGHINRGGRNPVPKASMAGRAAKLVPVAAAGYAGWEVGSYINDEFVAGTAFGDKLGEGLNRVAAFFGNEESKRAVSINERYERQRGEMVIRLEGGAASRARLERMHGENLDLKLEAGPIMGGP
ncbi:MAG: phage tail tape measure protein [Gammaproteobacteria bacterium]|nr:phage tail tape measure protein [Gammaproteobacteria bacterium]